MPPLKVVLSSADFETNVFMVQSKNFIDFKVLLFDNANENATLSKCAQSKVLYE